MLSPEILAKLDSSNTNIYLTAHGLDTVAYVSLNGHQIGQVNNMFVRYRWNVRDQLYKSGIGQESYHLENILRIEFISAQVAAKNFYERIAKQKYSIPPGKGL